jgi:formate-dependent nitrite reductase membrane component NrfD
MERKAKYRSMKRRNLIAASFASIVAVGFLYSALTPPSYFNFIPLEVYQSFFMEVTPSGK